VLPGSQLDADVAGHEPSGEAGSEGIDQIARPPVVERPLGHVVLLVVGVHADIVFEYGQGRLRCSSWASCQT